MRNQKDLVHGMRESCTETTRRRLTIQGNIQQSRDTLTKSASTPESGMEDCVRRDRRDNLIRTSENGQTEEQEEDFYQKLINVDFCYQ